MGRALLATVAALLAVLALCVVRYAPPAPAPREAPIDAFSAQRARDVQEALVGPDGASRSVGSEGNARARKLLLDELGKLGLKTETQRSLSCSPHGTCAIVQNVIGTLEGTEPALAALLLCAHYDSVPVSPGANDDGVGVATVIEATRAIAAGPRPRRTVVVLLTDGEEDGLLGGDAFVVSHPLAKKVGLALNVDARGNAGPSSMFETSSGNAWLVSGVMGALPRPVTTSLFYEIYRQMPNDTDFTALRRIAQGINFANIVGLEHYHTPDDSLPSADPGTLQHHGDHLLAAARALATFGGDPASEAAKGDAVWFDLLAAKVVSWPEDFTLPLAIVALLFVGAHAARYRSWDPGVFVGPTSLAAAIAAPFVTGWAMHAMGALPAPLVATPGPALVALHGSSIAGGFGASSALARRATPRSLWVGTWLAWGALGVTAAIVAPGTSYLFVVPTLAAGLSGAARRIDVAAAAPAVVAATLFFPLSLFIYDALGFVVPVAPVLPTALIATTLSPFWSGIARAGMRTALVAIASAVVAVLVASVTPPFSPSAKQRVNVVLHQDEHGDKARVFVDTSWGRIAWGAAPLPMKDALGEGGRPTSLEPSFPWSHPTLAADVPKLREPAPALTVRETTTEGGSRKVRVHVKSRRGASTLGLRLPAARTVDVSVCPPGKTTREQRAECARAFVRWSVVLLRGVPKEGMDVELSAPGEADPIAIDLFDRTPRLPKGSVAAAVAGARPTDATQSNDGDGTILSTSFAL